MQCRVSRFQSEDSGEHPCGVCRKGVVSNSIRCVECLRWVRKRCCGISGKLKDDMDVLGLHSEWVVFRDVWRSLISGKMSNSS